MKGNKGKNRGMAHRRWTHDLKHVSFTRRSVGPELGHSCHGGRIGDLRANCEVIDLTEVAEPIVAEPFFEADPIEGGTYAAPPPREVLARSGRQQPKILPWEGGDQPWPARSSSFVCA